MAVASYAALLPLALKVGGAAPVGSVVAAQVYVRSAAPRARSHYAEARCRPGHGRRAGGGRRGDRGRLSVGPVGATLANVAVAKVLLCEDAIRPTKMVLPMLIVAVVPICVHDVPLVEE